MKLVVLSFVLVTTLAGAAGIWECATCHPAQAKPQPATAMAHALELPPQCTILKTHPLLTFKDGPYSYRIERRGEESLYTVSDGKDVLSVPISWAVGLGSAGQTYIYQRDGQLYQSRVSYYSAINGLDFTIGATNAKPVDLVQAAGQRMDHSEQLLCFGCHSTNAVSHNQLTLDKLIPGVQCERCHGPSDAHIAGFKGGRATPSAMKDLRKMSAEDAANFCGQCHRTWDQIATSGIQGVVNVRFQPYRLTNSKCFDSDDARIACTSCHNAHELLDRNDANYDRKCQACHAGGKPQARPCPVSTGNCVSCHMPKIEIPGSHKLFTDHQIRIARANAPYPN